MSRSQSWMLYGASGYTGTLIARHAHERGHRPLLAGRSTAGITALAGQLGLPHRVLNLDDPAALSAALDGVDLVLNAAGPFLHTAAPLAEACLAAGAHYLDIGNELQVFLALYDLDQLPGPVPQRRGRRRADPRRRRPGRHRPAGPRNRGIRPGEPPLRRLDPPGGTPALPAARLGDDHDRPPRRPLPRHAVPHR